jgi:hypothetical protein
MRGGREPFPLTDAHLAYLAAFDTFLLSRDHDRVIQARCAMHTELGRMREYARDRQAQDTELAAFDSPHG